jgi:hypothetical protein
MAGLVPAIQAAWFRRTLDTLAAGWAWMAVTSAAMTIHSEIVARYLLRTSWTTPFDVRLEYFQAIVEGWFLGESRIP